MAYFDGIDDQQLTPEAEAEARRRVLGMIAGAGKPSILGQPQPSTVTSNQPGTRAYDLSVSATNPPNVPAPRLNTAPAPEINASHAFGTTPPSIATPPFLPTRPNVMPRREDFPEGPGLPTWKKVLGLGLATLAGPQRAGPLAEQILNKPKLEADRQFNQATQDWERSQSDAARAATTREANARAAALEHPQAKPEKPENLQQAYADAVTDAQNRGVDPAKDPKVQQIADAINALQKQPAPPKDMTAKAGTVNGQPAWGIQTDQGWIDPETRKVIHGFTPQPSFAETGLWEPTMMPDPSGKGGMVPAKFNKRTGEVVPIKGSAGPIPKDAQKQIDESLSQARNMDRLDSAQKKILSDVEKRGQRGPLGGGPYLNGPESMQFLANHVAMTLGGIKGVRPGRDLIEAHVKARDLDQATEAMAESVLAGGVITYSQAQQMLGTTAVNRQTIWQQAKQAATQYGVPDAVKVPAEFAGPSAGPKVGDVEGGYRFKGGDPSKKENWEKVQ